MPKSQDKSDTASDMLKSQDKSDTASDMPKSQDKSDTASDMPKSQDKSDTASDMLKSQDKSDTASDMPKPQDKSDTASDMPKSQDKNDTASNMPKRLKAIEIKPSQLPKRFENGMAYALRLANSNASLDEVLKITSVLQNRLIGCQKRSKKDAQHFDLFEMALKAK